MSDGRDKLLLFDFDGVIANTTMLVHETHNATVNVPLSLEEHRQMYIGNVHDALDALPEDHGITEERNQRFANMYGSGLLDVEPEHEVLQIIDDFRKTHKIFMVTSGSSTTIRPYCEKHDFDHHFDGIACRELHPSKEHKIRKILDEHQCAPDHTLFITDTLGDIREANAVGVSSIGVTWGMHERQDLKKGEPFSIVDSAEELRLMIDQYFKTV